LSQIDIGVPLTNCIIYFLVWFTNSSSFHIFGSHGATKCRAISKSICRNHGWSMHLEEYLLSIIWLLFYVLCAVRRYKGTERNSN